MRLTFVFPTLFLLLGCGGDRSDSIATEKQTRILKTRSYDNIEKHSPAVQSVIKRLKKMQPGYSVDSFQRELKKTWVVDTPYQHFKDFEYYWSLEKRNEESPSYIIAGAFFISDDGYKLTYATINIVEQPKGKWRTIWSIEYQPDGVKPFHHPKIRGVEDDE